MIKTVCSDVVVGEGLGVGSGQGEGDGAAMRALVEDQTRQMMAYSEFLAHCHRYILSKVA